MNMKIMKRGMALVIALLLVLSAAGTLATEVNAVKAVKVNKSTFPDAKFRAYVKKNVDLNKDNTLSVKEIKNVDTLELAKKGITNLKGIEYFINLRALDCSGNRLTKLDVSKNNKLLVLDCMTNRLKALNLSKNKSLLIVNCMDNKLTKLDLGTQKQLIILATAENKLKTLDIKGCTILKRIVKPQNIKSSDKAKVWMVEEEDEMGTLLAIDTKTKLTNGKKVLYKP